MSSRTFLVLVSALLVTLALLFTSLERKQNLGQELLMPGLAVAVNDIDQIELRRAGREAIATLQLSENGWTVAERSGYPADLGKIRQNILTLAGARIIEEKTSDPQLYRRLGVEDIDSGEASGVEIAIRAPTQTMTLIVGDTGVQGDNAFVRRAGEVRSWLVSADLDLGRNTADWLARELIDIPAESVQAVEITRTDGSKLRIEKNAPEDSDFNVTNIPQGRELSYASVASGTGSVLSGLSFDDVAAADEVSVDGIAPIVTRFDCFDGLVVQVMTYESDDAVWTRFSFSANAELATRFRDEDDSEDDAQERDNAVRTLADELEQRHRPWLYNLPSYKSDQLVKRLEDLLKPAA